jgi:hypothetical protein
MKLEQSKAPTRREGSEKRRPPRFIAAVLHEEAAGLQCPLEVAICRWVLEEYGVTTGCG